MLILISMWGANVESKGFNWLCANKWLIVARTTVWTSSCVSGGTTRGWSSRRTSKEKRWRWTPRYSSVCGNQTCSSPTRNTPTSMTSRKTTSCYLSSGTETFSSAWGLSVCLSVSSATHNVFTPPSRRVGPSESVIPVLICGAEGHLVLYPPQENQSNSTHSIRPGSYITLRNTQYQMTNFTTWEKDNRPFKSFPLTNTNTSNNIL